jgi:hypothetical protein
VVGRDTERDPRVPDLSLRPHEPLRHGRLGDEEGARDLRRRQPADLAQRERDAEVDRERRVAAREHEFQPVVGDRRHPVLLVDRAQLLQPAQQLRLAGERPLTPDAVDRAVAGGRDDPRARAGREPVPRPALHRSREGVLHRVLGEGEIAEDAGEDCDGARPFLAVDAIDRGADHSTSGRISTEPLSTSGTFDAKAIASSRSPASTRKYPPIDSFVSA